MIRRTDPMIPWADNTDLTEDEQQEMMAEAISYEEGE